ncbi:Biotin carboxyl carrier protein of acetyl-CoA carboxylase [Actinidia chinensis var. chinensis]|uniref:Biotin carboxyl carrier protein of acetyl-CoA carboxylase n=1 Tax=Actinidia chinensis var. chinensis TaxID=1590841 RepID=A0A2R6PWH5_ACTCC|nr:Biotin carboxyl carrier protein of acetyl-CoA carboxylase [Actinidia chinensis var. chinensis]
MASSIATAASGASSLSKTTHSSSTYLPMRPRHLNPSHSRVSFRLSPRPKLRFSTKGSQSSCNLSKGVRAQLNEVAVGGSSNDAAIPTILDVPPVEAESVKPSSKLSPEASTSEESISEFITQVSSLVKLVDSRDIVELQLKQLDCELLIRKKEALPQPTPSAPVVMMHSPPPPAPVAPPFHTPPPAAAPAPAPAPATSTPTPTPSASKSSFPPLKCPMAGTFYRSPSPGAPPFVKVGDKVQKGQVLCVIEAMKLMNEIEADKSGTIVEILVQDGKPVSVDLPLFVIQP